MPYTVKRKDVVTGYDIDLKIVSKAEREAEREKKKTAHLAMMNVVINNPSLANISKTLYLRKAFTLQGYTSEEARVYISPSYEELQALQDIELINRDKVPEVLDFNEDHMTYIVLYQRALNTSAKRKAIEARKMLYIQSGQALQQPQAVDNS